MEDLLRGARVVIRTSNMKISRRRLADYGELKNYDRKWDTVYCASAACKFGRRGLVDVAKHSSVTSSCFTSFGRYKSSVFRLFFKCSLHFFAFINPDILSFFSLQAMLTENSANEFFFFEEWQQLYTWSPSERFRIKVINLFYFVRTFQGKARAVNS